MHTSIITQTHQETPQSSHLVIKINDPIIQKSFYTPGQYAVIKVPNFKEGYFAMSNLPGNPEWTFLIKNSSPLTAHLLSLKVGDKLEISEARGNGYNMKLAHKKDVWMLASGSGIAPIRSSLLFLLKNKKRYGKLTLVYGCRHPEEMAYAHEFSHWGKNGIEIIKIISSSEHPEWLDRRGYVQDHIPKITNTKNTAALVCGMKPMIEAVFDKLTKLGLKKELILTNV